MYKDVEGASTQWDDIQRKLGNLPPKPPAFKRPPFTPETCKPKDKNWIGDKTQDELDELEDDPQLNDDRFLQEYRFRSSSPFYFSIFILDYLISLLVYIFINGVLMFS